ncbi:hypothetical protein K440DRAFT_625048, partial [Wilcoxina mikolae CBS 423.85]
KRVPVLPCIPFLFFAHEIYGYVVVIMVEVFRRGISFIHETREAWYLAHLIVGGG